MTQKSHTSRTMSSEERRAATVDAVIELAAEQNPNDITTAAIATKMGVTQGALFRHFASKDAVLQAVMGWVAERLLTRIDKAAQGAPGAAAALEAVFMAHVGFVLDHPGVPRLLFGELQRGAESVPKRMVRTLIQGYRERIERLLQAGVEQGEFDQALDIAAAATLMIGVVQGLVVQGLFSGDIASIRGEAGRVFALYLRGIARQPSQPSGGAKA